MDQRCAVETGWAEVIAPLSRVVDLQTTARQSGALVRRREIRSAASLLRLVLAWAVGAQSLRQAAAWAGAVEGAEMGDAAVLRRLRKTGPWLSGLVEAVLHARWTAADGAGPRPIRLIDGSTFAVPGGERPGWRLHAAFDLASERFGQVLITPASEGERLDRLSVTPGEVCVADRGFARPDGLRHVCEHGGDFLVRLGARSLTLADARGHRLDWNAVFARARTGGGVDEDVTLRQNRFTGKRWTPLPARLIVIPLPPAGAQAARRRLDRAGQREGYIPSAQAVAAADFLVLLTSLERTANPVTTVVDLYRRRWQVELAFKRLKSLVGMRAVPTKDPGLARAWLHANLLVALLVEDFAVAFDAIPPWGRSSPAVPVAPARRGSSPARRRHPPRHRRT